jgi:hypothetical protein
MIENLGMSFMYALGVTAFLAVIYTLVDSSIHARR